MHISSAQIEKVFKLHLHKVHSSEVRAYCPARGTDQVTLSRQATEMQSIKQSMSNLPEIRQDIVSGLKTVVDAGTYQVTEYDLASAMFTAAGAIDRGRWS